MLTTLRLSLICACVCPLFCLHHCIYSWSYANVLAASVWWINQGPVFLINKVRHGIVGKNKTGTLSVLVKDDCLLEKSPALDGLF